MHRTFTDIKGNENIITCNVSFTFVSLMFSFLASFLGIEQASSSPHYILSFECAYQCSQHCVLRFLLVITLFHFFHEDGRVSSSLLCVAEYHCIAWASLSLLLRCTDIWVALHVSSQKRKRMWTQGSLSVSTQKRQKNRCARGRETEAGTFLRPPFSWSVWPSFSTLTKGWDLERADVILNLGKCASNMLLKILRIFEGREFPSLETMLMGWAGHCFVFSDHM